MRCGVSPRFELARTIPRREPRGEAIMATVRWPSENLVTLTNRITATFIDWDDGPSSNVFAMGDSIEVSIRLGCKDPYNGDALFEYFIDRFDPEAVEPGDP